MCRLNGKGFTLIELLVVVAVIAILSAILFPVFTNAVERGRQSACSAQLREVDQAFHMYIEDYDETLPYLYCRGSNCPPTKQPNYGFVSWTWLVYPNVNAYSVFWCPSDAVELTYDWRGSKYKYRDVDGPLFGYLFSLVPSWGYNGRYLSPGTDPYNPDYDPYRPINLSRVQQPASTLLLVESGAFGGRMGRSPYEAIGFYRVYPPSGWRGNPPFTTLSYGHCWPRHFGKITPTDILGGVANVAFVDGHVKAMTLGNLTDEENLWKAER